MEIVLKFKIFGSKFATDTQDAFWKEYCRQAGLPFNDDDYSRDDPDGQYSPSKLEAMIRTRFVPRLNNDLSYRFGRLGDRPSRTIVAGEAPSPLANIILTLSRIEYNSLDLIMKVLGLDDGAFLPLLCGALEVYASDTLNSSMPGGSVDLRATAEYDRASAIQNLQQVPAPNNTATPPETAPSVKEMARNKLWGILNGSLILPVILALAVLYQMAGSVDREHVEVGKERALLAQERNAILQSLSQQIAVLTQLITDRSKSPSVGGSGGIAPHP